MSIRNRQSAIRNRKRLGALVALLAGAIGISWALMIRMPGKSYRGALPPLTREQVALRNSLQADLEKLAGEIGERNLMHYSSLLAAAEFVRSSFGRAGYRVHSQEFEVEGKVCANFEVEISGGANADEIVIVGAHYDSVGPGANDNGSGIVATLALARTFAATAPGRTLRFAAWVNEEPPYFQTEQMGSRLYARRCRQRGEKIVAMLSLETIGYYSDQPGSQLYPFPFGLLYPSRGDFITFIGNVRSRRLLREVLDSFRRNTSFPSEGAALPPAIAGVGWSDHWSFWQEGYPAVMVTDTALFRYPYYHTSGDTPDKIDYDRLARVVSGLRKVIENVVSGVDAARHR